METIGPQGIKREPRCRGEVVVVVVAEGGSMNPLKLIQISKFECTFLSEKGNTAFIQFSKGSLTPKRLRITWADT